MVGVGRFHEIGKVNAWLSGSLLQQNEQLFLSTLFIQMHMVINILLDLLIGSWI